MEYHCLQLAYTTEVIWSGGGERLTFPRLLHHSQRRCPLCDPGLVLMVDKLHRGHMSPMVLCVRSVVALVVWTVPASS